MTHSLECEVALKDRLPDLCEDGALGVGQIHLPDACVSQAALIMLLGFLCLSKATDTHNCVRYGGESCVAPPHMNEHSSTYLLESLLLQPPLLLQLFVDCIGLLLQGAVGR